MREHLKKVINKIFSARYLMTVCLTFSFCYGFIFGMIQSEIFVPVVLIVIRWYFERSDREKSDQVD